MNKEQLTELPARAEETSGMPVVPREMVVTYIKPELNRLGVLAAVANSQGPTSDGAFWNPV